MILITHGLAKAPQNGSQKDVDSIFFFCNDDYLYFLTLSGSHLSMVRMCGIKRILTHLEKIVPLLHGQSVQSARVSSVLCSDSRIWLPLVICCRVHV